MINLQRIFSRLALALLAAGPLFLSSESARAASDYPAEILYCRNYAEGMKCFSSGEAECASIWEYAKSAYGSATYVGAEAWTSTQYGMAYKCNLRNNLGQIAYFATNSPAPYCNRGGYQSGMMCVQPEQSKPETCPKTPDPIAIGTGNKVLSEEDLQSKAGLLRFLRNYRAVQGNELVKQPSSLGIRWTYSYSQRVVVNPASASEVNAFRENGGTATFRLTAGVWQPDADIADRLTELKDGSGVRTGWRYFDSTARHYETYDASGRLQGIRNTLGESLSFLYSDGSSGQAMGESFYAIDTNGVPTATLLPAGLLVRVRDDAGVSLLLEYLVTGNIARVSVADRVVSYGYTTADMNTRLTRATYPDGKFRQYIYGESAYTGGMYMPFALTGVIDETNTRRITYWYDAKGRAKDEQLAGGVGRHQLGYYAPAADDVITRTTVTDPLGAVRTYRFQNILGVNRLIGVDQPGGSGCGASSSALGYDANGNITSNTDFNGRKSCSAYDLNRNLETVRIEGLAAASSCPTDLAAHVIATPPAGQSVTQSKTSTQWHPDWRLETRRAEPKKLTTWVYNGQPDPTAGNAIASCAPADATVIDTASGSIPIAVLCKKVEQATADETGSQGFAATPVGTPRVTQYSYNRWGKLLTEDGPRTDINDITTYEYWPIDATCPGAGEGTGMDKGCRGELKKITNPAGHITEHLKYNAHGQVLESRDAKGVLTQYQYDLRGRLTHQTVAGKLTQYQYDPVGQLKKVIAPDNSWIGYDYDAAQRLTDTYDNRGNRITYTLDAAGNRTREEVKDPNGTLKRAITRLYDQLGRLQNEVVQ